MLSLQANAPAKIKMEGLQYETKKCLATEFFPIYYIENPSQVFQCAVWVFYFLV